MTTRQITVNIPEKVLLAEKTDEDSFARELRVLAVGKATVPVSSLLVGFSNTNCVEKPVPATKCVTLSGVRDGDRSMASRSATGSVVNKTSLRSLISSLSVKSATGRSLRTGAASDKSP